MQTCPVHAMSAELTRLRNLEQSVIHWSRRKDSSCYVESIVADQELREAIKKHVKGESECHTVSTEVQISKSVSKSDFSKIMESVLLTNALSQNSLIRKIICGH